MLSYDAIKQAHESLKSDHRGRAYSAVLNDNAHKELYFATRYHNIHRLITHCSQRPKVFKVYGVKMFTTKQG